jgi:hypothetical protein
MATRALRGLVPIEIAIVLAAAALALPIPTVVPLLAAASLSMWLRGRSWASVVRSPALAARDRAGAAPGTLTTQVLGGLAAGAVALAVSLFAATPLVEQVTDQAVQWSMYPIVRGQPAALATLAVLVVVTSLAAELVLRGWIVERALELRAPALVAVLIGALAEALVVEGDVAIRLGAGVFGGALGWLYVAGGRSIVPGTCARLAFSLGALALEALQLVG